jgi:hypothetical protein
MVCNGIITGHSAQHRNKMSDSDKRREKKKGKAAEVAERI